MGYIYSGPSNPRHELESLRICNALTTQLRRDNPILNELSFDYINKKRKKIGVWSYFGMEVASFETEPNSGLRRLNRTFDSTIRQREIDEKRIIPHIQKEIARGIYFAIERFVEFNFGKPIDISEKRRTYQ